MSTASPDAAAPPRQAGDGLEALLAEIRACRLCRDTPRGKPLPHEPRPVLRVSSSARLAIAGQAPGTRVHKSGVPFTDPSGDRLRQWMGVDEAEFYDVSRIAVIPMGFCFPGLDAKGGDLPPRRECAPRWRARLLAELPRLELILLAGQYAQRWHLCDTSAAGFNVTRSVQHWRQILARNEPPRVFPLPHPSWRNNAWIKANPWFEADALPALRLEVRRLIG
ncbi:MAG: uracil-DNA glycosylase family protein [Hyphomicrobiaceae bacterium]|nr:uracil-DNA glycosylase family protein [Hyphomicrobiaceae bacterium]